MKRTPKQSESSSGDFYLRMLEKQKSTADVEVPTVIEEEGGAAAGVELERNHLHRHDREYGIRVVEDFRRAQALEQKAYFPSAEKLFDTPDRVSADQYLAKMRAYGCFTGDRCSVIDLCCGSGNITGKLLECASDEERGKIHVVGLDVNADAIASAQNTFAGVPEVRFLCANALQRKSGVEPVDVVICNTSMHEFPKPHLLLQGATRLATKLVMVKDLVRPRVGEFWHVARSRNYHRTMFQLFYESLKSSLSPEEMEALAEREGFTYEPCPPIYGVLTKVKR